MYFLPMFATRPDRREVSPAFHIAFFYFYRQWFFIQKERWSEERNPKWLAGSIKKT